MKKGIVILLAVLFLVPLLGSNAQAQRKHLKSVNTTCETNYDCTLCHVSNQGGGERTAEGEAFLAAGHDPCVICPDAPSCGGTCDPSETSCTDGVDNDCDGLTDCDDTADCDSDPACGCQPQGEIPCDGIDQDCDGSDFVDCQDPACTSDPSCQTGGCGGHTDKASCNADPNCEWSNKDKVCNDIPICTPTTEIPCNGIDEDCDGSDLIDCGDSRCDSDPSCGCQPTTEIPCNGTDEDCDGSDLIDCQDPACTSDPACQPTGDEAGNCKDGIDNDGNGKIDCADSACTAEIFCQDPNHRGINSYDGPSTCLGCHSQAGSQMLNSVHGSWLGSTPNVVNISGSTGKWGQTNNYCTDPQMANYACLRCHVSLVGPPELATVADMDCLVCHNNNYDATFEPSAAVDKVNCVDGKTKTYLEPVKEADGKYHKHPRFDLMPAGTTMIELARTVHLPDNESCLIVCHSEAGGGDGIKRGDLDSAMVDPPVSLDVHLSSSGVAKMTCTDCHVTANHKIPGRGNDLRPTDATTMKKCVDCHVGMDSGGGHAAAGKRSEPDRHVARVHCTACHISSYGDGVPTEMTRDWTQPKWSASGCENQGAWVGTTTKGSGVTPTYRFWTGDSWVYDRNGNEGLSPDPDDGGVLRFSYPIGDINNGKLYPFKVHVSVNPVENGSNMTNFDVLQMFFTGCYDDAARDGLDFIGATGAYTWEPTKAYQLITHGIGPAATADDCSKCHGNGRIDPDTMSELDKLGYHLKDGDGNGIINDADRLIICSQCHQAKAFKRTWEQMHAHTAKGSGIGCYFCHEFQRPERNLCSPCDPACVAEFVDTNPFPHQCP